LERLRRFALGDDDDARFGDREAAPAVVLDVVADDRVGRDFDFLVDDRPAYLRAAADIDAAEQDRILDAGKAVDAHVGRQDAAHHLPARDDGAGTDDAVVRLAAPPRRLLAK